MNATEQNAPEPNAVDLTPRQQELLLRGLKFVRSSVALHMEPPSEKSDESRQSDYAELDDLEAKLSADRPRQPR